MSLGPYNRIGQSSLKGFVKGFKALSGRVLLSFIRKLSLIMNNMTNQQLNDYVSRNIGKLGAEQVKKKLLESGWDAADVDQAIKEGSQPAKEAPAQSQAAQKGDKGFMLTRPILLGIIAIVAIGAVAVFFLMPGLFTPPIQPAETCGNGVCGAGESSSNCPGDCGSPPPATYCGDGNCDSGEDSANCPADCVVAPYCGDGNCDSDEDYRTCDEDCVKPPPSPITLSVSPTTASSTVGNSLSFDIVASGAENMFGFQFNVDYDSNILEFTSMTEGPFLNNNGADSTFCIDASTGTPGSVRNYACTRLKSGDTATGVDGSGTIATITFSAKSAGQSSVTISNAKIADIDADEIPPLTNNAQVTIS